MRWYYEETLTEMFSDEGYTITREKMAVGWWYNAYSPVTPPHPNGVLLASSGNLDRCIDACMAHQAGQVRGRGKRQFRPTYRRPTRHELAMRACAVNRRYCL